MNFVMSHAPGAGSIAWPVDQQSSALPLYRGYPQGEYQESLELRCVVFEVQ